VKKEFDPVKKMGGPKKEDFDHCQNRKPRLHATKKTKKRKNEAGRAKTERDQTNG